MNDYSFNNLSDKEFEILGTTLLGRLLGKRVERFKRGKDQGADGRFFTYNTEEIIIQCKHYPSGFKSLKSNICKRDHSEIEKVKLLNPKKYYLITSAPLSRANKSTLKDLFLPYIKQDSDIFGQEDLNDLLRVNKDVEKSFYKLWLSSTNVLESMLNRGILGRSSFHLAHIQKRSSRFVQTDSYNKAKDILLNTNILIIEGEPGIGKTTLAEAITYPFIADEYDYIYIDSEIADIESMIEPEKKQLFFFDDFLGHNYLDLLRNNKESKIVNLITRIKNTKNKYLIFTTRTNILSQAKERYDVIANNNLELHEFVLAVSGFSRKERAQILYNHLYFSDLPNKYIDVIFQKKNYLKIIDHKNYNPRIIEHFCEYIRIGDMSADNYWKYIILNLDNPVLIWNNAYENQINEESRLLLETLFSLGDKVEEDIVKEAFNARLFYEKGTNNVKPSPNPYNRSYRELSNIFIDRTIDTNGKVYLSFFNPSIADFLLNYFRENDFRRESLLSASKYIEQITTRFAIPTHGLNRLFYNYGNKIELTETDLMTLRTILPLNDFLWKSTKSDSNPKLIAFSILYSISKADSLQHLRKNRYIVDIYGSVSNSDLNFYLNYIELLHELNLLFDGGVELQRVVRSIFESCDSEIDLESILKVFGDDGLKPFLMQEMHTMIAEETIDLLDSKGRNFACDDSSIIDAYTDQDMNSAKDSFITSLLERISYFEFKDEDIERMEDVLSSIDYDQILMGNLESIAYEAEGDNRNTSIEFDNTISEESSIEDWFTDWRA